MPRVLSGTDAPGKDRIELEDYVHGDRRMFRREKGGLPDRTQGRRAN